MISVVTPWRTLLSAFGLIGKVKSECVLMSMKPGATASPEASMILVAGSHYLPKPMVRHAGSGPLNQRTDQMIGRTAMVAEDFRNGQGPVTVGDSRWSAESADGSDFAAGTRVEIVSAESTLLKVKRAS